MLDKIIDFLRFSLPRGIKNLIFFAPVIWKFRAFDYAPTLEIFVQCLKQVRVSMEWGGEVPEKLNPKLESIDRAVYLLSKIDSDEYRTIEGIITIDGIIKENNDWFEIWQIVSGNEKINGSDMRGWWS